MSELDTRAFDALYGNDRLKQILFSAAASRTLSHAYIFEGAPGSGRHTVALLTAMTAACQSERFPCLTCQNCRKLREGISPDLVTVTPERDRKTLGVESIRSVAETVYIAPNDLDVKIYILPNADAMTTQAQNALLKLLEEPPAGVYFFLLCDNSANLLPTVKSRAPTIKMQKFTDPELTDFLLSTEKSAVKLRETDETAFRRCVRLADGSIGAALSLLDSKSGVKMASLCERSDKFFSLLSTGKRAEFIAFTASLTEKRDELATLLELISNTARDLIASKYGAAADSDGSSALKLAGAFTAAKLFSIADSAEEIRSDLQYNINIRTALTALAAKLCIN